MKMIATAHPHQCARKWFNLLCALSEEFWEITAETIANTIDISISSAHTILTGKLKWNKLSTHWLLKSCCRWSSDKSKSSKGILSKWDQDPEAFPQGIVTGVETWLYQYKPEDKAQVMVTKSWKWSNQSKSQFFGMLKAFYL